MSLVLTTILAAGAAGATPPAVFVFSPEGERMVMERPMAPAEDGSEPPPPAWTGIRKGEPYRMVDLTGAGAGVAASDDGGTLRPGCGGEDRPTIPFDALPPFEGPLMLVPGTWPAAPKTITRLAATDPSLLPLVAAALKDTPVRDPAVTRGTAVLADLDGDGVDETIFSVSNMAEGVEQRAPGGYTLLAVAWAKDGKPSVVPLAAQVVTEENADYGEVTWEPPELVAVADIDGDGAMEIVAIVWGYEVMEVNAWTTGAGGSPQVVASASCAP